MGGCDPNMIGLAAARGPLGRDFGQQSVLPDPNVIEGEFREVDGRQKQLPEPDGVNDPYRTTDVTEVMERDKA